MTGDTNMDAEYEAGKMRFCQKMKPMMPLLYKSYSIWSNRLMSHLLLCENADEDYMDESDASDCIQFIRELADAKDEKNIPKHLDEAHPELIEMNALQEQIDEAIKNGDRIDPENVKRVMYLLGRQMNFIEASMKETGMM